MVHAPCGLLNENKRGVSSVTACEQIGHEYLLENKISSIGLLSESFSGALSGALSRGASIARPSARPNVVSSDSARRRRKSSLIRNLSTTASSVCFLRASSFRLSSSAWTSPSTRTRKYPCALSSASICVCSPLRSCTTGASNIMRLPSGMART